MKFVHLQHFNGAAVDEMERALGFFSNNQNIILLEEKKEE